jgi:hypothetical protein
MDPSRGTRDGDADRRADGRDDRAAPRDSAGAAGWLPSADAAVPSPGTGHCSIAARGHTTGRSKRWLHNRHCGKTVVAAALRGPPSPPFRRDWTTATRRGKLDLIFVRCFGQLCWVDTKKPRSRLTVGVFPFRLGLPYQNLGFASAMMTTPSPPGGSFKNPRFLMRAYTMSGPHSRFPPRLPGMR